MRRIIIIGPSGSGKTTLARQLSKKLDIPHTELDSLFHGENWQQVDDETFKQKVDNITKHERWIICGNYFHRLGGVDFWVRADTVIWCDYPFRTVFPRLLRRTIKRGVTNEELWNGNRESFRSSFLSRDSILLLLLKNYRKQKHCYEPLFTDQPKSLERVKLIRLRSPKDARRLLSMRESYAYSSNSIGKG